MEEYDDEHEQMSQSVDSSLAHELEHEVRVKSHVAREKLDECGYCGQVFGPEEIVIERNIHGMRWRFCSEECYRDFNDASNFKDDEFDDERKNEQGVIYHADEDHV